MKRITDQAELDRLIQHRVGFLRNADVTADAYKWHDLSHLQPNCRAALMTVAGYAKHYAATEADIPAQERSHRCGWCRR